MTKEKHVRLTQKGTEYAVQCLPQTLSSTQALLTHTLAGGWWVTNNQELF